MSGEPAKAKADFSTGRQTGNEKSASRVFELFGWRPAEHVIRIRIPLNNACNTNSCNDNASMSKQMAEQLRDAVRNSGVSLLALSKLCGVPQPRLFDFMGGKDIRMATAQKLADHFGLVLTPEKRKKK